MYLLNQNIVIDNKKHWIYSYVAVPCEVVLEYESKSFIFPLK